MKGGCSVKLLVEVYETHKEAARASGGHGFISLSVECNDLGHFGRDRNGRVTVAITNAETRNIRVAAYPSNDPGWEQPNPSVDTLVHELMHSFGIGDDLHDMGSMPGPGAPNTQILCAIMAANDDCLDDPNCCTEAQDDGGDDDTELWPEDNFIYDDPNDDDELVATT
jgi:hypothetical protein